MTGSPVHVFSTILVVAACSPPSPPQGVCGGRVLGSSFDDDDTRDNSPLLLLITFLLFVQLFVQLFVFLFLLRLPLQLPLPSRVEEHSKFQTVALDLPRVLPMETCSTALSWSPERACTLKTTTTWRLTTTSPFASLWQSQRLVLACIRCAGSADACCDP